MARAYQTFALLWQERTVDVSFQAHWLNSDHWHIELRCAQPLPVTQTGYRSYFVPCGDDASEDEISELVMHWLDQAAQHPDWQRYLAASRQLDLFG